MLSTYHTKYFAYELTRRCLPDSVEKVAGALADAQVDLKPHRRSKLRSTGPQACNPCYYCAGFFPDGLA